MKKLNLLFIFTALLLMCCVGTAKAVEVTIDGIKYDVITDTKQATVIIGGWDYYSGDIVIPSEITYNNVICSVTSIGEYAFFGCTGLTSIEIPNSVISIGESAFAGCSGLTNITIPNSVTSIGNFYQCSGLTSIVVDPGNTKYDSRENCNAIIETESNTLIAGCKNSVIPNSVTSIGYDAFYECTGLTSITIPNSVTSIGEYAFFGCTGLTSITIPNSITSIGERAFEGCTGLKTVINLSNLTFSKGSYDYEYIAYYADNVYNAPNGSIEGDYIFGKPNNVNTLLYYLSNESELTLPADYKGESYVIGESAFKGNNTITSITIPNSVTSIGNKAFYYCDGLKEVHINDIVAWCNINFGNYDANPLYYAHNLYLNNELVTELVIPNGVTSIGNYAFENCSGLTSITIPNSVISIGQEAFDLCSNLKTVINLSNLTFSKGSWNYGYIAYYADKVYNANNGSIEGDYIFGKPNNVNTLVGYLGSETELTLPADYKGESYVIGESAFECNNTITSITILNSVTSIGNKAFYYCDGLTSVTIGSGVLEIGNNAFNNPEKVIWLANTPPTGYTNAEGKINYVSNNEFTNLQNVYVYPYLSSKLEVDGIIYVLNPAERTCDAIDCAYNSTAEKINIGETISYRNIEMTVKTVMPYTCYGNSYIKEVEISNKGNIGVQAFYDCNNIKSIEITNVINIESNAFEGCTNLPNIVIPNSVESIGAYSFKGCTALNNVTLEENVTAINDNAFENCSSLPEITIPVSVTAIANNVFKGCSKLADVIIADRIKELSLGSNGSSPLFADCPLDSVYVGAKLRYNTSPFYNNKSLRTIVFGNKETNIYEREFDGCSALENITLGNGITEIGNYAFIDCIALPNIVIPNSVTSLGAYSFKGCTTLNSVTLGENVTTINDNTFESCTNLPKIVIPNSVKSIGAYSFKGCTALNSVTLGKNVTAINDNAFENCSSLPEITIPVSVTAIANNVFKGCSKLADVIIADRIKELSLGSNGSSPLFADCPLDSVYIGGEITYNTSSEYGYSPFYRNTSLRSVVISDLATKVYTNEFYGCTALTDVIIGHNVKNIGDYAFSGCSSLNAFTFGTSIEEIGKEAFSDCVKLTSITSYATIPPTCGAQALEDINIFDCSLYVPSGYAQAYQQAEQWKNFLFVEELATTDNYVTYMIDDEVYKIILVKPGERIITPIVNERENYTFSGWNLDEYISVDGYPVMPDEDITISAHYIANSYTVTYIVDGEVFATDSVAYGSEIVLIENPAKEGYTFSGWSEVPATMPAENITVEGIFTKNETGIDDITAESIKVVYDLNGNRILDTENLERGIYIINGKKTFVK